jgi:hypothetical protein
MKVQITLVALALVLGVNAHAAYSSGDLDMKCISQGAAAGSPYPISVQLKQMTGESFKENEKVPFAVAIKSVRPIGQEVLIRPVVYTGQLETEDVMVNFASDDSKVQLSIYLDELDQSSITIEGKTTSLNCGSN